MKNFKTNQLTPLALSAILVLPLLGTAQTPGTNEGESSAASAAVVNAPQLEAETNKPSSENTNTPSQESTSSTQGRGHWAKSRKGDQVIFAQNIEVKPDETVNDLVVFGGSAL